MELVICKREQILTGALNGWIELSLDYETYSEVNLKTCGLYIYASHPSFEIMLCAWSYTYCWYENGKLQQEDTPTLIVDLVNGEVIPEQVRRDMVDPRITKTAHNVPFEFYCSTVYFKKYYPGLKLDGRQWVCTMVKAAMVGLPMALDMLGEVLNLSIKKHKEGTTLIAFFCVPRKATKKELTTGIVRTRNYPHDAPDKWERFKNYCIADVEVEKLVKKALAWFHIPQSEMELWSLDQEINRRGVRIESTLAVRAIEWNNVFKKQVQQEAIELTGLSNPNSIKQLKKWLSEEIKEQDEDIEFEETDTLNKDDVPRLISKLNSDKIKRVLELRKLASKTSISKYRRMLQMADVHDRIRGSIQFCGAGRTWRFAGRGVQPHNYPRNDMKFLDMAREIVMVGHVSTLQIFEESVPVILSQLLRTTFIPKPGHCFYVSDYSSIEACILAWLAGEQWVLDVLNGHGKLYEATASMMFKIPIEQITKGSPWRQRGKIGDLACGYGGSVGALLKMKALEYGLTLQELPGIVKMWRDAHPKTVEFWNDVNDAVKEVLIEGGKVELQHGIIVAKKRGHLFIKLPSGRELVYCGAFYDWEDYQIKYWGVNQSAKKWELIKSYGGKFVENIVQAIARDILKEGLLNVSKKYDIVLHIHDEIISEAPEGFGSIEDHNALMCPTIKWAPGLPLKTAGFKGYYYKKD